MTGVEGKHVHLLGERRGWDPFPAVRRHDDSADRTAANRAVSASAVGLGFTGLLELAIALFTGSVALLGDALHNLSDVSTSAMLFVGFRVSKRPATSARPYGYERAEDLAGLGVALVIWASAVFTGVASYHKLVEHGRTGHVGVGMAAAVIGIIGNQLVARYKMRVGRRIQSATLVGDARHSWLDALSSAGALIGLAAVAAGWRWGDPVAGFAVTGFIAHVGWEVSTGMIERLMDGVDPVLLATAEGAAGGVPGVRHVHVRGRWMGRSLLIDVEGFVDAGLTVDGSDRIGRTVEDAVHDAVPQARAVQWSARAMPAG